MLEIGFRKKEKIKRVNARHLISLHEQISISEITNNTRNKRLQTNMMASIIYSIVIFKYSYSHHCITPPPILFFQVYLLFHPHITSQKKAPTTVWFAFKQQL